VPVNWCPALGTVLANEEVVDGKSERGGHPVYRTPLRQWMLKITAYADRLAEDLALVDWPEGTLTAQRRWIGRSEGAEIVFGVEGHPDARIAVFTTRPDTLMGATYVVLAPEHELTRTLATPSRREAVVAYVEAAARKSELDRVALARTKTGVSTGAVAIHPITGARLPIWVADYVLGAYGTGAGMAIGSVRALRVRLIVHFFLRGGCAERALCLLARSREPIKPNGPTRRLTAGPRLLTSGDVVRAFAALEEPLHARWQDWIRRFRPPAGESRGGAQGAL
jgi:hypothetical protein